MKIESRMLISQEAMRKLLDADESAKGTDDYMKYRMEWSCKFYHEDKGKWTKWLHSGYSCPIRVNPESANSGHIIRIRNGNVFMESFPYFIEGTKIVERYRVTDEVMKLLDWEIQ